MKQLARLLAALTLVLGAAGCASSPHAGSRPFVLALGSAPGSLDPQASSLGVSRQLSLLLYDSLVNSDHGAVVPGLASSWRESPRRLTMHLRAGVRCADGSVLRASDVAANIAWVEDPAHGSPLLDRAVPAGVVATADDSTRTVLMRFPATAAGFLLLGLAQLPVVCRAAIEHRDRLVGGADGTGPYRLAGVSAGSVYTLRRNDDYRSGPPGTDVTAMPTAVEVRVVEDQSATANLLLSGAVDAATVVGPDETRLAQARLVPHHTSLMYGEVFFNENDGHPTSRESVRRGLSAALDLPALRRAATAGTGRAPVSLLGDSPCGSSGLDPVLPRHDNAVARRALQTVRGHTFTLLYQAKHGAQGAASAELAAAQWRAAGVTVHVRALSDVQLFDAVFHGDAWDIVLASVDGATPAAERGNYSGASPSAGGSNFAHIANAAYDAYADAAAVLPGLTGCDQWRRAERALVAGADVVPYAVTDAPTWTTRRVDLRTERGYVVPTSLRVPS